MRLKMPCAVARVGALANFVRGAQGESSSALWPVDGDRNWNAAANLCPMVLVTRLIVGKALAPHYLDP